MQRFSIALVLSLLVMQSVQAAPSMSYDANRLIPLMQAKLDAGGEESEYVKNRLESEINRIRSDAAEDVRSFVESETQKIEEEVTTSLDRQNALIVKLEDVISDAKSDADVLVAEEKRFYANDSISADAASVLKQTNSHAELLAKKMVLDEYIAVYQDSLQLQKQRRDSLLKSERWEQFSAVFEIGKYLLIIFATVGLDRIVRKRLIVRIKTTKRRYFLLKLFSTAIYATGGLFLASLLLTNHPGFFASLAIVGAGIAIALQDLIKDFVGWILILQRRYYKLGQRVTVGTITGDVIDISPLRTTLLEVGDVGPMNSKRTGKTILIPNSRMLQEAVMNYNSTNDFVASDMSIVLTYESDWRKAEKLLLAILIKHTGEFSRQAQLQQRGRTFTFYAMWDISEPQIHIDIVDSGIQLSLRFYVPIGGRRTVMTELAKDILAMIESEPKIELAYNTMRILRNLH